MTKFPRIVTTCAPLRLSFAGGGTDLPSYYTREDGSVLSTTINQFVYVTVKSHGELFGEQYRLNYYDSEHAQSLNEIQNDIVRECLKLVSVDPPLYISTVADLPSSSGLGSSSSFAVSLLHALHAKRQDRISVAQLAEEACHIEMNVLKHPIGKQDQYAAAFGGLNQLIFQTNGDVTIEPQSISASAIDKLFEHIMLFWTKMPRNSAEILEFQNNVVPDRMESLRTIKSHCLKIKTLLTDPEDINLLEFGNTLDDTWQQKRSLTSKVSTPEIDNWYCIARNAGAYGGKVSGAGGGGFLMLIVPPKKHNSVRQALGDLPLVPIRYEAAGSRVLIPLGH
ncbi:MAG: GHMP kinase [Pseudomonadota bacterium]|nr:GHMP kinase [Pseudomonadota bacterium]